MAFTRWTAGRVALVSLAWIVLVGAYIAWRVHRLLDTHVPPTYGPSDVETVVGVSMGIEGLVAWFGVLFGPPILHAIGWSLLRRRVGAGTTTEADA